MWLYVIIAVIVVWLIMRNMSTAKGVKTISTDELKNELKTKNKSFIDVRTPGEYKSNHIREFKNIPLNQLQGKVGNLSKDKGVVVICQSGMRSSQACKLLKKQGFDNVTNVKGGMNALR